VRIDVQRRKIDFNAVVDASSLNHIKIRGSIEKLAAFEISWE
jgi:hypothetical protein